MPPKAHSRAEARKTNTEDESQQLLDKVHGLCQNYISLALARAVKPKGEGEEEKEEQQEGEGPSKLESKK